ncbi:GNAT family N-acetyltransferase [Ramlibacter sp.]|uniref:GNAT family N-acetyltransferase n=1 Tax=Ramlibacter sp. TaxID=1917967 RepID=UPI0017B064F0|nr:GNAT family N-acetyltransferase [Ramlibacter sp.]MBA2672880.1 GNAT family N-acetyltransferase [Ramlibacter sp.]
MNPLAPPLRWREPQPADAAFLDELFLASRDDLRQIAADPAFLEQLIRMQQSVQDAGLRQAYPAAQRLLVERSGEAVGQAIIDVGAHELRLLDIAVVPRARRTGAARAVVAHLQQEAAARGLPMGLTVNKANTAARSLYLALGFTVASEDMLLEHMAWRAGGTA